MTRLKQEAHITGLEFVSVANRLKEERVKLLKKIAEERDAVPTQLY